MWEYPCIVEVPNNCRGRFDVLFCVFLVLFFVSCSRPNFLHPDPLTVLTSLYKRTCDLWSVYNL